MLETILLILSVLIIALVLLQSNKASGDAGQIFSGGNDRLFGVVKERGLELIITRLTAVLGVAFFVISLVLYLTTK